jgi:hypothetical protein
LRAASKADERVDKKVDELVDLMVGPLDVLRADQLADT